MRPEFTLRLGTQDPLVFREVLLDNCYRLPQRFEPGDAIVDVGANIGCFTVACLARGAGHVLAVEPHPDNFALLKRNTALWFGQVGYQRAALYNRSTPWVRLCDRGPHSAMHFVGADPGDDGIAVTAPRVTLDDLLALPGEGPPTRLLKLDCEGGEYPGLLESSRLRVCREIVVECHLIPHKDRHLTDADARNALEAAGFEITAREAEPNPGGNVVLWARNKTA